MFSDLKVMQLHIQNYPNFEALTSIFVMTGMLINNM